jgi:hypothetical protein
MSTATEQAHAFTLAGTQLTGTDVYGCLWTVETIDGWFDGADIRTDSTPKAGQDGNWLGTPLRSGLHPVLRGKVFAPSTTALELAARRLSAILTSVTGTLSGISDAGEYTTTVQLADRPLFQPLSDIAAVWQLSLESTDPRLYGTALFYSTNLGTTGGGTGLPYPLAYPLDYGLAPGVVPGTLFLPNTGTISYPPRLRIDGPVTNPIVTLAETGDWVKYTGTIPDGSHLDLDAATRRVLLNGSVSHDYLVTYSGSWLAVPVGGGSLTWTADTADANALLSVWAYQGAWI